jgi:hypothetical protein
MPKAALSLIRIHISCWKSAKKFFGTRFALLFGRAVDRCAPGRMKAYEHD